MVVALWSRCKGGPLDQAHWEGSNRGRMAVIGPAGGGGEKIAKHEQSNAKSGLLQVVGVLMWNRFKGSSKEQACRVRSNGGPIVIIGSAVGEKIATHTVMVTWRAYE